MKKLLLLILIFIGITACEKSQKPQKEPVTTDIPVYDSTLAAETGADDYGMRRYVMAFLKEGPNRDQDSTEAARLQRAHLDNITRMAEGGKLVMAGPFFDDWEVKGIYIFAVETVEEAEELTKTDPAIQAGRLIMELHPWYGSAALMKAGDMHKRLAKESI
ncbi:YciI family protein [Ekhidna sp. To15]|uniref:YciI family protein n=1 Tax=Ekhidna sp. To15 TaxID=3395267 RepID=UPI003F5237B5